jgi:hypothetical protein
VDLRRGVGLKVSREVLVALIALFVSWLLAASTPLLRSVPGWNVAGGEPEIPFLLTPGAESVHVRSSVYFFVIVLAAGMVSVAPIEVSKFLLTARRRAPVVYGALSAQQVVTFTDVIRSNAADWWTYLLSVGQVYQIDEWSWMEPHWSLIGRWPWPSALSAVLLASFILHRSSARPTVY